MGFWLRNLPRSLFYRLGYHPWLVADIARLSDEHDLDEEQREILIQEMGAYWVPRWWPYAPPGELRREYDNTAHRLRIKARELAG
jgi:hypothetical protein